MPSSQVTVVGPALTGPCVGALMGFCCGSISPAVSDLEVAAFLLQFLGVNTELPHYISLVTSMGVHKREINVCAQITTLEQHLLADFQH